MSTGGLIESAADLRAVIHELGASDPDPGVVAEKICAQLTNEEAHVVAQATLRNYVRLVLVKPASATTSPVQAYLGIAAASAGVAPGASAQTEDLARYATASGQRTASAATAALIDWYAAELMVSVHVGEHQWKHLGACTQDDVKHLVDSRRSRAADVLAEAKRFERLLAEMKHQKSATVADLDPDVGREVLAR